MRYKQTIKIYNVLDICRYIINYSNKRDYGVSNLKLQKLLYFVQAYFLLEKENQTPCFSEKIEAFDFGPIVMIAYQEYKQYASTDIPSIESYIEFDINDLWRISMIKFDENCILDKDKKLINDVIDKFADFSATDLLSIIHNQTPWKNAYKQYPNNEITIDSMKEYFMEKQ